MMTTTEYRHRTEIPDVVRCYETVVNG